MFPQPQKGWGSAPLQTAPMTHPASCGVLMPESGADGVILVQYTGSDGEDLRQFLTGDGSFLTPPGVFSLWVELIGGGTKGGSDGDYVAEPLAVRPGQPIPYAIGRAAEPGFDAGDTAFGPLRASGGRAAAADLASAAAPAWIQRLD